MLRGLVHIISNVYWIKTHSSIIGIVDCFVMFVVWSTKEISNEIKFFILIVGGLIAITALLINVFRIVGLLLKKRK